MASATETVSFTLNGRAVVAVKGEKIIEAAERNGVFIPRFCYHPRMRPVGVCRMCLVEVSGPRGATLQPACYVDVAEGMEVSTASAKASKAQEGILEFLLVNHPLDCPVCDKGGECPLQDQAYSYGPGESRFVDEKRHWAKPIPLNEFVLLDRERCIQCSRCTRFAAEVAGEATIDFISRGDSIEVGRFAREMPSPYFSGNIVQICPVGALTAGPFRFVSRPWDAEQVETTCTVCALGCRMVVQSQSGEISRVLGVDSDPVNHGWLCDKGRFGFDVIYSEERIVEPMVRKSGTAAGGTDGDLVASTWSEAMSLTVDRIAEAVAGKGPEAVAFIGGARLANEDQYAWGRLAREVIGTTSVDVQIGDGLDPRLIFSLNRATVDEACTSKCLLSLGGDVRELLPVLFLRLREAIVTGRTKLVELSEIPTSLSRYAETAKACTTEALSGVLEEVAVAVEAIVGNKSGEGLTILAGRSSLAASPFYTEKALAEAAMRWPQAKFLPLLPRGNVMGALELGLAPGLLPGRRMDGRNPGVAPGKATGQILERAARGEIAVVVLLGSDPAGDFPDEGLAMKGLAAAGFVVAVDAFENASTAFADVFLPVALAEERDGTVTNIEGRVASTPAKVVAPAMCWPEWAIASRLATELQGQAWTAGAARAAAPSGATGAAGRVGAPRGDGPGSAGFGYVSRTEILAEIAAAVPGWDELATVAGRVRAGRDGVVLHSFGAAGESGARPLDPIAFPGIDSIEKQGASMDAGGAADAGGVAGAAGEQDTSTPGTPSLPSLPGEVLVPGSPAAKAILEAFVGVPQPDTRAEDRFPMRLSSPRVLFGAGQGVAMSKHLAGVGQEASVVVNGEGVNEAFGLEGVEARVSSPGGSVELPVRIDPRIPPGVAMIPFNAGTAASILIATGEPVTYVSVEPVSVDAAALTDGMERDDG